MKTRDEQANKYADSRYDTYECRYKALLGVEVKRGFEYGWDAALKSQWRDADKEKPEDGQEIFFRFMDESDSLSLAKGCYWENGTFLSYGRMIDADKVTHWMPIPDLP